MDMTSAVMESELTVVAERSGTIEIDRHTLSRYVVREVIAGNAKIGDVLGVLDGDFDLAGTDRAVLFLSRFHDVMWRPNGATRAAKDGKAIRFTADDGRFSGPTAVQPNTPVVDRASRDWYRAEPQPADDPAFGATASSAQVSFDDAVKAARTAAARADEWRAARLEKNDGDRRRRILALVAGPEPTPDGIEPCPAANQRLAVRALDAFADASDIEGMFAIHDAASKRLATCMAQDWQNKLVVLAWDTTLPGPLRARALAADTGHEPSPRFLNAKDPSVEVRRVAADSIGQYSKCLLEDTRSDIDDWLRYETDAAVIATLKTKLALKRCRG
jgi:hypothetical protein